MLIGGWGHGGMSVLLTCVGIELYQDHLIPTYPVLLTCVGIEFKMRQDQFQTILFYSHAWVLNNLVVIQLLINRCFTHMRGY